MPPRDMHGCSKTQHSRRRLQTGGSWNQGQTQTSPTTRKSNLLHVCGRLVTFLRHENEAKMESGIHWSLWFCGPRRSHRSNMLGIPLPFLALSEDSQGQIWERRGSKDGARCDGVGGGRGGRAEHREQQNPNLLGFQICCEGQGERKTAREAGENWTERSPREAGKKGLTRCPKAGGLSPFGFFPSGVLES